MGYFDFTVKFLDVTGKERTITIENTTRTGAKQKIMTEYMVKRIISVG